MRLPGDVLELRITSPEKIPVFMPVSSSSTSGAAKPLVVDITLESTTSIPSVS